jgi:polyphosphate glucokinase
MRVINSKSASSSERFDSADPNLPVGAPRRPGRPNRAEHTRTSPTRRVLVIDVGGTSIKILATGQDEHRSFPSGPKLTPEQMVSGVKELARGWSYDAVSIGYPGPVLHGRPIAEPYNLGRGWVGFDFAAAFGYPVKVINDAAMQALGSYKGGKMLFLGLGTGLGSTMIVDGIVAPMELGHLPYRKGTYEDYVGRAGLKRHGEKKWRRRVADVVGRLIAALEPDDVVIGGGNAKRLDVLPPHSRAGDNANAFRGGFRLWERNAALPRTGWRSKSLT